MPVFFNWYLNFTKPYELPISNVTGPITTAQPSLNIDTPLSIGTTKIRTQINKQYTYCVASISTVYITSRELFLLLF